MTNTSLLNQISSPKDIKNLSEAELSRLCLEIRNIIVNTVSQTGGHLASNLGVVELTVAIHSVFDVPFDKIVFDVGHQCYAHKLLTGRLDRIGTIRQENGLSGFPKRSESPCDCFNTGHSSTSISAAYGIACSAEMKKNNRYTVVVIGDGALSGGLAYEGLNNAGRSKKNLIVILNDNKMSISENVGSMARYLSDMRIKPTYLDAKSRVQSNLEKLPAVGKPIADGMRSTKEFIKDELFGQRKNLFEYFGFRYYGPYDGHDITQLRKALKAAKRRRGPVLVHICTVKGKGYEYAEKNPGAFHGISSFDIKTGDSKRSTKGYSDVFGEALCDLAEKDKRICAITAAMSIGTGLDGFAGKYKERFYDVGIAEEHAVTFAAGLAAGKSIPVFAVYSTFLQRSYDQILHDAALQNLHIVLAVDRAGIVGEDGETHQGIFDVAFFNTIPNVTVYAPSDFNELRTMLNKAVYDTGGVAAVRYPRGGESCLPEDYQYQDAPFQIYGSTKSKYLIITYGRLFVQACAAKKQLAAVGRDCCILKLNTVKPIPQEAVLAAKGFRRILFAEEGIRSGGVGEAFGFMLYQNGYKGQFVLNAIEGFVPQAKTNSALHHLELDSEGMVKKLLNSEE